MTNYRPIPLRNVFIMYVLKIYAQQLCTNNILITEQYGLRKGTPTENAKFRITDCLKIY